MSIHSEPPDAKRFTASGVLAFARANTRQGRAARVSGQPPRYSTLWTSLGPFLPFLRAFGRGQVPRLTILLKCDGRLTYLCEACYPGHPIPLHWRG